MKVDCKQNYLPFLSSGGEMGRLMREKDWSNTSMGCPAEWPETLRVALGIILQSRFPMFLFWGPDLICFYNDAYRPSLGSNGKHPEILGSRGEDFWPEVWHLIKPLIDQVMNGGEGTWSEDQLIPIWRNGGLEEVYWTFSYSRLSDEHGIAQGVFVTCYETTAQVFAKKRMTDREDQLNFIIDAAELGTWTMNIDTGQLLTSRKVTEVFGLPDTPEIELEQAIACVIETDRQRVLDSIAYALTPQSGGLYDIEYSLRHRISGEQKKVRFKGRAQFNQRGNVYRFSGIMQDITEKAISQEKAANIAAIVESSDDAIFSKTMDGIITSWNNGAERIFGYSAKEMIGQHISKLFPPGYNRDEEIIMEKIRKGERIKHYETKRISRSKQILDISLTVSPILDADGRIIGVSKIGRDITSQKMTEQRVTNSEARLQIVVEASDLGTWELDLESGELTYSPKYLEMLGHKEKHKVPYHELLKQIHPDDLEHRTKAMEAAYLSGKLHYVCRVIWDDGSMHWIEARGRVIYNNKGNPVKLVGTSRDMTDEKNYQQRIEESEGRLRIAAISSELGTWIYDQTTDNLTWDNATRELFGIPPDAPVSIDLFWSRIHPDDLQETIQQMKNALDPEKAETFDLEFRVTGLPQDQLRWIHAKGKAFFNEKREATIFAGTALDVTAKRKALDELQENEQKFRLLADSMSQFVMTADQQGNVNYVNRFVHEYSGLGTGELLNRNWLQIVHADDRDATFDQLMNSISMSQQFLFEHRFRRHDGEYRWHLSRSLPQLDSAGIIQTWVITSIDIHDRKMFINELEMEVQERTKLLKQSNENLLQLNEELAQFAYVASHDLQEPLRKIQTFSSLLLNTETDNLSEKGKMYFDRIQAASSRMQQLIIELLTYSRTNNAESQFVNTPLESQLAVALENLKEKIESSGAMFSISPLPTMRVIPFQMEQLFTNLVGNAIKFSRPGTRPEIKITAAVVDGREVAHTPAREAKKYVRLRVEDNGIGFENRYKEKIFQVFQRLHNKNDYPGTGIGLAICKKIAENHDGFIEAFSTLNEGSVFELYLPEN